MIVCNFSNLDEKFYLLVIYAGFHCYLRFLPPFPLFFSGNSGYWCIFVFHVQLFFSCRYLQQRAISTNKVICNYHFFNTYFYEKLKEAVSNKVTIHCFRGCFNRSIFSCYVYFSVHGWLYMLLSWSSITI